MYKLSPNRKRVILTSDNKQVAIFNNGYEHLAKELVAYLNEQEYRKEKRKEQAEGIEQHLTEEITKAVEAEIESPEPVKKTRKKKAE